MVLSSSAALLGDLSDCEPNGPPPLVSVAGGHCTPRLSVFNQTFLLVVLRCPVLPGRTLSRKRRTDSITNQWPTRRGCVSSIASSGFFFGSVNNPGDTSGADLRSPDYFLVFVWPS